MTLIDQRILISAPMPAVWQIIADHRLLPKWRVDVMSVSILTTEPSRVGTRRRIARKGNSRDIIEEMLVWYEGIGYEYALIEGSDYRAYRARIRLQAAADGTIVQWVISYEFGGVVRRVLGGRRRKKKLEALTTDSLRQLRRYIESTGVRLDDHYRLKNSMQAAPDAQARAQYGAKLIAQESSRQMAAIQADGKSSSGPNIVEPPIRLDDTPTVPPAMPPSFLREALQTSEFTLPSGVKPVLAEERQDTRPGPATDIEDPVSPDADTAPKLTIVEPTTTPDSTQPHPTLSTDVDKTSSAVEPRKSLEMTPIVVDEADDQDEAAAKEQLPPVTSKHDTGEVSIWDVFGMRRPSDELSKIITELEQGDSSEQAPEEPTLEEPTNTTAIPLEINAMPEHDAGVAESDVTTAPAEQSVVDETVGAILSTPDEVESVAPVNTTEAQIEPQSEAEPSRNRSLEEWLAADEPPLPKSSTGSMKTIVRIDQKPKIGLRRLQRQREESIRRRNSQDRKPKRDDK